MNSTAGLHSGGSRTLHTAVGIADGARVGVPVGTAVGFEVGTVFGAGVGTIDGADVGARDGAVGDDVGARVHVPQSWGQTCPTHGLVQPRNSTVAGHSGGSGVE